MIEEIKSGHIKAEPSYNDPLLTLFDLKKYVDDEMLNIDIAIERICKTLSGLTYLEDTDYEPRSTHGKSSTFYGTYDGHLSDLAKLRHRLENIESQLRHKIGIK